ncbi:Tetratricopeptide repeat-containing protein [Thermomonospora echinospora]|uniref:Tetratricopeptide repeat-containing protein n=1 Tax=Thermomonospora echinospora TaxID=1992 RepID=A0A1H5YT63_9ACTN|nr:tetratricopeptide repeat protein [Thermomonospora echinospora]SEG27383.1 Tetratricopeptide repeat-containing protein [Thermomonospora echinospora]
MAGVGRWLWRVLWGLGLAAVGALAVAWLTDRKLVWLAGMVGAVTGGFAPTVFDWLKERAVTREALGELEELAGPVGGPAGLLDPRRQVVEFVGRDDELTGLIAWCEDVLAGRVRLLTGPGGMGKTRLSVQLCVRMAEVGWRCVRVADGAEDTALSALRAGVGGRVLLVVDYAETRVGLSALLRQVAADTGTVRVLLLARSAGEWWDRLKATEPQVRTLIAGDAVRMELGAVLDAHLSDAQVVERAVPRFAAALGVEHPVRAQVEDEGHRARVLDLHAAALVAVLRALQAQQQGQPAPGVVRVRLADVLGELLGHEERYWLGSAQRAGLLDGPHAMTPAVLRQIVAAGCLLGAATKDEALRLLERVPDAVATPRVTAWLRELYPPATSPQGTGEWLGSLQPDRLAEHHTIAELSAAPDLAEACLTDLDDRQALRAITLLGRASVDLPEAAPLLERLLGLVERIVADLPADLPLLTAIANAIPYPSLVLAETDVAITRRILDTLSDRPTPERAYWLDTLGVTLSQTGRPAPALPVTQEAVAIYRELAESRPDRHRSDLARSLSNLGVRFSALGRPADALPVAQEAVTIYRELAEAYPDRHRPDFATSLSNLGITLSELGRPDEAENARLEAEALRRDS